MAEETRDPEKLRRLCGLLIGAGRPLGLVEIASASGLAEDEIETMMAGAKDRLASVGLCLLTGDNGRWFVALDVSAKATVGRLNGQSAGRKEISPEAAEILALIREKGRLTVKEIHRTRGTNPRNALNTLVELGLVRRDGRAKGRGGPMRFVAAAVAPVGVDETRHEACS